MFRLGWLLAFGRTHHNVPNTTAPEPETLAERFAHAVMHNDLPVMQSLKLEGASPDEPAYGERPVVLAAAHGSYEAFTHLRWMGANMNAHSAAGETLRAVAQATAQGGNQHMLRRHFSRSDERKRQANGRRMVAHLDGFPASGP